MIHHCGVERGKMENYDQRFVEYYNTGYYRGFRKISDYKNRITHTTYLIFTNGERKVFASGGFKEEALCKIFDRIDRYYSID